MSTFLRGARLIDNCTPSISYDDQVKAACEAFDFQMWEIIDDTGQVVFIPNIMGIKDSKLIDILAWQFHVDFYDSTRDLEFRKRLVQLSIVWHMTKGTVELVNDILETYFPGSGFLQEWFEYKDPFPPNYPTSGWHDRYKFRIIINDQIVDPDTEAEMLVLIDRYKPVSRWLEAIIRPKFSGGICYASAVAWQRITRYSDAAPLR